MTIDRLRPFKLGVTAALLGQHAPLQAPFYFRSAEYAEWNRGVAWGLIAMAADFEVHLHFTESRGIPSHLIQSTDPADRWGPVWVTDRRGK